MTGFPTDAILITIKVASFSTAISFAFSVLLAYVMSRRAIPGRRIIDSLCTLPIVLPPTVLGFFLLVLVGRRGVFGAWLAEQGFNLIFSWQGAVLAATVVIFPRSTNPLDAPLTVWTATWRTRPAAWGRAR